MRGIFGYCRCFLSVLSSSISSQVAQSRSSRFRINQSDKPDINCASFRSERIACKPNLTVPKHPSQIHCRWLFYARIPHAFLDDPSTSPRPNLQKHNRCNLLSASIHHQTHSKQNRNLRNVAPKPKQQTWH